MDEPMEEEESGVTVEVNYEFLRPKVEALLWKRERESG